MAGGTITTNSTNAPAATAGLEHKAASVSPESGLLDTDDATGVVEAIVSVTGVKDDVDDVILPGAYTKTLGNRRAKGIFHHDWARWAARTEEIRELKPGDPGLPKQTKDGKAWPAEAGGLYVKARFNLKTEEGRSAYENVKFFSETGECDWSIGYKVPRGAATRDKAGVRHIKEVDLYEYSPVLFGAAGSFSGTLSVKTADATGDDTETDAGDGQEQEETPAGDPAPEETPEADPDEAEPEEETPAAAETVDWDALDQAADAVAADMPADGATEEPEAKRFIPHPKRQAMAKGGQAMPDGAFPIETVEDLKNAIQAIGRAKDPAAAKAHIMKRANALGAANLIPDDWKQSKKDADGTDTKLAHEPLDHSPAKNWVENTGELPAYIQHIAKDLAEQKGMPLDRAIPTAIAACKRWAAGGGDVKPDTRAKAAAAIAEWEKLKAKAHVQSATHDAAAAAKSTNLADIYDADDDVTETVEVEEDSAHSFLPGTYEELREQLTAAATKAYGHGEDGEAAYLVDVVGTWPDRFVAACFPLNEKGTAHALEVPYFLGEGAPVLGEETPVKLAIESGDGEVTDEQTLLPYPTLLDDVTAGVKAHLLTHLEDKAGRVLSGANAMRLKTAVEQLVAVLESAGVHINTPDPQEEEVTEGAMYPDSTAPSAQGDAFTVPSGKMLLDPGLMARAYRILGDVHTR